MLNRLSMAALALALTAAVAFGQQVTTPGQGPAAVAEGTGPAPWGSFCSGQGRSDKLACRIEQRVVLSNSGQLLTAVAIELPAEAAQDPTMTVQLPNGLFLPAGLRLGVDSVEVASLPFQTCDGSGCYAQTPVTVDLVAAMQRGTTLTVTFQDVRQVEIAVPVSLAGFSAALARTR
jgi:invasion protein IalB